MNFEAAAKETFEILRQYNNEVVMDDAEGKQVFEPNEGRRFFAKPKNLLVSIVDEDEKSSVRLYLGKNCPVKKVKNLTQALRTMATKYNMVFHCREYDHVLSPKDFATKASVTEGNTKEDTTMNILEGMYGTSRSSYLKLENARMIVRHSRAVNENLVGARSRNIDSIYIENGKGERMLFPTTQLAPARAMAHHVDNGGSWADQVGQQISRMATDFSELAQASRHIGTFGNALEEDCQELRGNIREKLREMRRVFEGLCRKSRYPKLAQALSEMDVTLNEADLSEQVAGLAAKLNVVEGRELSENVLTTVARFMEDDKRFKMPSEKNMEIIGVLERPVNKAAWEAFKAGTLELRGEVDLASMPKIPSMNGKRSYILSEIAKLCVDDSMANLCTYVADQLGEAPFHLERKIEFLADKIISVAGVQVNQPSDGVARTPAIREFAEWIDSFTTDKVLVENYYFRDEDGEDETNEVEDDVIDNFDVDAFLNSEAAEELAYHDRDSLSPEEKLFTKEDIIRALEDYLNGETEAAEAHTVDPSEEAELLYPKVAEALKQEGYSIEDVEAAEGEIDECNDEDTELSREDILLPKDKKQDLIDEVTPPGDQQDHINRLMSLAGMGRKG